MPPFAYRYVWQSGTSRGYMEFNHVSVLLEEVINSLQVKPSGCYKTAPSAAEDTAFILHSSSIRSSAADCGA